ncbi:MAG TPA: DNRLRE domain-containing protein, partial [Caldilineaceae bacterium]|nr:DNRLRE domain-containing protein [Caldilineaceae bacterium]
MKSARKFSLFLFLASALGVWLLVAGTPRLPLFSAPAVTPLAPAPQDLLRFAAIGDFGMGNQAESDVAALVKSWNPGFVITLGDNNYPDGAASTIDQHIGKDWAEFIFPYAGAFGPGASENRFFPSLGNHDWNSITCTGDSCSGPYLDYFALPGNERYYDFVKGPVHFFVIDSDPREPDGRDAESAQADWLREGLQRSSALWKVVYMHHTIHSSSLHGSQPLLQWPYQAWGAHAVLTGHDHTYERVMVDGFPYIVNGLGGAGIRTFGAPVAGSVVRYNGDYGAMLVEAETTQLRFRFINRSGATIDDFSIDQASLPTPIPTPQATVVLQPVADTFVNASQPSTNYGSGALLEIDGSPRKIAYLRFDLSGLAGATLRWAQVRLWVADVSAAGSASSQTVRLDRGTDWDETSLTYDNRPAAAPNPVGAFAGGNRASWTVAPLTTTLQVFFG